MHKSIHKPTLIRTRCTCDGGWWGENGPVLDTSGVSSACENLTAFFPPFFSGCKCCVDLLKKLVLMVCGTGIIAVACCFEPQLSSPYEHKAACPPTGSKLLPVLPYFMLFFPQSSGVTFHGVGVLTAQQ